MTIIGVARFGQRDSCPTRGHSKMWEGGQFIINKKTGPIAKIVDQIRGVSYFEGRFGRFLELICEPSLAVTPLG